MARTPLSRISLAALALAIAAPATAQDRDLSPRVDKLEREMHAVQRKVFPGGAGQSLQPEIVAPPADTTPGGVPASQPVQDLTARVDALERSLSQLTNQVEENSHALREAQDQATRDRTVFDTRLKALEGGGTAGVAGAPAAAAAVPPPPASRDAGRTRGRPDRAPPPNAAVPDQAPASDVGAAPTSAATGDPAEDAYMAGYRLWTDKQYDQAETALKAVVAKYPKHRRASYAQNLLGRAYLDDGKPALAAEAFYANYQKMPRGERAPDSLYYLGVSLTQLKKPVEACKVYDELQDVYGATLSGALKTKVADGRTAAKCK